jgi:hypothetical protein
VAYLDGRTLVVGDHEIRLPHARVELVATHRGVLVWDRRTGRVTAYRQRDGVASLVAESTTVRPVVVTGGYDRVLVTTRFPEPRVDIVKLRFPRPSVVIDSQVFPVPCCPAVPFEAVGTTQFGEVLVDTSAGVWVWDSSEGREGVPDDVPDSDEFIRPLSGAPAGRLVGVGANLLYFKRSRSYVVMPSPEASGRFDGLIGPGVHRFREAYFLAGARVLRPARDGGWVAVDLDRGRRVRLPVPADLRSTFVVWEDLGHVVLDVTDETGARGLVRCDIKSAACEDAGALPADAVLASFSGG